MSIIEILFLDNFINFIHLIQYNLDYTPVNVNIFHNFNAVTHDVDILSETLSVHMYYRMYSKNLFSVGFMNICTLTHQLSDLYHNF